VSSDAAAHVLGMDDRERRVPPMWLAPPEHGVADRTGLSIQNEAGIAVDVEALLAKEFEEVVDREVAVAEDADVVVVDDAVDRLRVSL
jgi:hypothetical protein